MMKTGDASNRGVMRNGAGRMNKRGGSKRRPAAKEKRPRSAIGTIGAAGSRCGCKERIWAQR